MLTSMFQSRNVCRRAIRRRRCGATILECAITLPVLFIVLFAILDLGIAATRYNALAEVSRRIAREAVLHGSLAPDTSGTWGPEEYDGTAADSSAIVAKAHDMTPTMIGSDVSVRVTWPDNDNSPRDRVQVEVAYEHKPLIPGFCPWGTLELHSVATMHIVN
jgi:Flp pilus assembly protein TadG